MEIETIDFKSIPTFWGVEKESMKNNTARFTDDWNQHRWNRFWNAKDVVMENTETGEFFVRKITHRCVYKNVAIISW